MPERARAATEEILARINKLKRFAADAPAGFRLPARSDDRDIVERNLEVISEASRRLPESLKAVHPDVDWRVLADLGNVLRHVYHRIDELRLIEIVVDRLDAVEAAVAAMAAQLDAE